MKFNGKLFNVEFKCYEHCSAFPLTMVTITFPDLKQELAFQHIIRQFGYTYASHSVPSRKCMMYDLVYLTNGIRYWTPDKFIAPNLSKLLVYISSVKPNDTSVPYDYKKFMDEIKNVSIECFGQTKRFNTKISQKTGKLAERLNVILNDKILQTPEDKLKQSPRKAIWINECTYTVNRELNQSEKFAIRLAIESFGCTFKSISGTTIKMYCSCGCVCPFTLIYAAMNQAVLLNGACNQVIGKEYIKALGGPNITPDVFKTESHSLSSAKLDVPAPPIEQK